MKLKNKIFFQFSKYTFIGICIMILYVFFMWLAIDILNFNTMISTAVIVTSLFFAKFYAFVAVKLIHKQFYKFTLLNSLPGILNWLFAWILIDVVGISAVISAIIISISLFIFRFIIFKETGLIK